MWLFPLLYFCNEFCLFYKQNNDHSIVNKGTSERENFGESMMTLSVHYDNKSSLLWINWYTLDIDASQMRLSIKWVKKKAKSYGFHEKWTNGQMLRETKQINSIKLWKLIKNTKTKRNKSQKTYGCESLIIVWINSNFSCMDSSRFEIEVVLIFKNSLWSVIHCTIHWIFPISYTFIIIKFLLYGFNRRHPLLQFLFSIAH